MNILDAYIKKYGQLVILILGLPCTNKSEIANNILHNCGLYLLSILSIKLTPSKWVPNSQVKRSQDKRLRFTIFEDFTQPAFRY